MRKILIYFCIFFEFSKVYSFCNRRPQGANGDREPVDENFKVLIDGNPKTYVPGQKYNISLTSSNGPKFLSFTIVVESENGRIVSDNDFLGHFELIDSSETKFSESCKNMIESTNSNSKSIVTLTWAAPTNPDSGCCFIKAAVLIHRNVWFIDDGFLTKRICPEEIDEINKQMPPMDKCCACDEARYEIVLERKWSRNTHTKDFPLEVWNTGFSSLIGASHTTESGFWKYGEHSSPGLQELAEHGSSETLETEIQSGKIRTIIKAPGISYRNNILGTTSASVRVDPINHVISLVSKISPSPDWVIGVAGLDLCLENCTWRDKKILNLYPWDIGTDAGPSYMSPDQPQIPPDVIRRITSTYPSDPRSPFYDMLGAQMKPLATLEITRKKMYRRECDFQEEIQTKECDTFPWKVWSGCSSKCGKGVKFRERSYKDEKIAESFNCQVELQQTEECFGTECGFAEPIKLDLSGSPECELTSWSMWSICSNSCGKGFSTRTREFKNPYSRIKCENSTTFQLQETEDCFGDQCGGSIESDYNANQNPNIYSENLLANKYIRSDRNSDNAFEDVHDRNNFKNSRNNEELPILCLNKPTFNAKNCSRNNVKFKNFWFYDVTDDKCKLFTTFVCDKNKNKFRTLNECMRVCKKDEQNF